MKVIVENNCGRCGKKSAQPVDLEEANRINTEQETRKQETETLQEEIKHLLLSKDNPPDIMVAHKSPNDGGYQITVMTNLCSNPGTGKGKRGCKERIQTLVKEIRLENKPKKKETKEMLQAPETPTEE